MAGVALLASLIASAPHAQATEAEPLEITDSGKAYLEAIGRRVDSNVAYFDPTRDAPELRTDIRPNAAARRADREPLRILDFDIERWQVNLVFGLILAAIAYFIIRNAGSVSIMSRRVRDADSSISRTRSPVADTPEMPKSLSAILANKNRADALVQLARATLARAAQANGLLLQRSWTARDALRRIPRDQSHLGAIRALVHAAERVQFGGYPISEEEFRTHVEAAGPLFRGAQS